MRIPNQTKRPAVGANMTPMIDVVFLLIIFFLMSSHLARQENRLPLDLPRAATFDPVNPESAALTISVDDRARMLVGGDVIDEPTLNAVLADLMTGSGAQSAIRIRCDGDVQYRHVEPILRAAARAGVTDAAIAVREKTSQ